MQTNTKTSKSKKVSKKWPIMNLRARPSTKVRLRAAAARIGISQGELVRRFVNSLPTRGDKGIKIVRVNIAP